MEQAVRAIGQNFTHMGAKDPRLDAHGNIDFRLARQLQSYSKADPPPSRVKPVPIQVLYNVAQNAAAANEPKSQAVSDVIVLGFYFLLRPGKYSHSPQASTPFRLQDVSFSVSHRQVRADRATANDLRHATFVCLTFTTQKNGVRGEVIGLGLSGHPQLCPVKAAIRRVLHLKVHQSAPDTPLSTYYTPDGINAVTPSDITATLRHSVRSMGTTLGIHPNEVSARSLRPAGAMALLCAQVDSDKIRLLGRWRSDEMLRYLHVQAQPVMQRFAQRMLQSSNYTMLPSAHP